MASLKEIRARLAAQENRNNRNTEDGEGPVYLHWNINEGDTAVVRFLDDANPNNPYFWVERTLFKFPFNGIKDDPTSVNEVIVQVPCMEMYGEKDTVLNEVRQWFKDPSMEEMGRKYWKKRTYIFHGFVRHDPMNGNVPENPIRRFMISPQIFALIKNSLLDPEIENMPTSITNGLDFRISKTTKGGHFDYTTSSWARKETALTDEEVAAIEKFGLGNLNDYLPPKPTEEVQKIIYEMFEASVNGEPYDPARWGTYFTPAGMARTNTDTGSTDQASTTNTVTDETINNSVSVTEAPVPEVEVKVNEPEPEVETASSNSTVGMTPQEILARIRSRQN